MTNSILIKEATIVNNGKSYIADLLIEGCFISKIDKNCNLSKANLIIEAQGLHLLPGMIDDQVHFREPGFEYKGGLDSESKAAIAGGITSYMEMPNTKPASLSQDLIEDKYLRAAQKSWANYSFYMGSSNDNLEEIFKSNPKKLCGIKIFLGASTGNLLVDNWASIEKILKFSAESQMVTAVHSEDDKIIQANLKKYQEKFGANIPLEFHPLIRSREACFKSSQEIIKLAKATQAELHILHLSTKEELKLLDQGPITKKKITAEVCLHHLWFSDEDYKNFGSKIKWNPSIKSMEDRQALRQALENDVIDIIATDHAPHSLEEKAHQEYLKCPAGGPLVQDSLLALLEMQEQGILKIETIVHKYAHAPSLRFKIDRRGFIEEGFYADLVLINLNKKYTRTKANTIYKCAWSLFDNYQFKSSIEKTFVNGSLVYDQGEFCFQDQALALEFTR